MPKVSVLMPVYKTPETYLREAIESILNQSYTDFEFLILDDCPENNREDIVLSYHDNRIKYYKNEYNMGISAARNKLLDMATGEYLAIFDHDDISHPDRLEKEVAYLDDHPEVGVVSSNKRNMVAKTVSHLPESNIDIKRELMYDSIVMHTACMLRRSVLLANNIRYEEKYSPAEDYMLYIRLLDKTMFHTFSEALVDYRDFAENTSHKYKEKMYDRLTMVKCVAHKEYPYLALSSNRLLRKNIMLFNVIPLLKINYEKKKVSYLLFGFIPLFSVKSKIKGGGK